MSIQELLHGLGIFTAGSVVITSIVGFIAKSIFNHWLNKDLAQHKAKLDKDLDHYKSKIQNDAELYKTKLQLITTEHQIKYSKLHEERAIVIKELYILLAKLEKATQDLIGISYMENGRYSKTEILKNMYADVEDYFSINKIFFNKKIQDDFNSLLYKHENIFLDFEALDISVDDTSSLLDDKESKLQVWQQSLRQTKEEIPLIKRNLEREFQTLLGVDEK